MVGEVLVFGFDVGGEVVEGGECGGDFEGFDVGFDGLVDVCDVVWGVWVGGDDVVLFDAAGAGDDDEEAAGVGHVDDFEVADVVAGGGGVLDECELVGELGEAADGLFDDFVEVDGFVDEGADGAFFGGAEGFDVFDGVDEGAVAFVGGDAAGAGVGLVDEAFFFELGHVVADGGWGDAEVVAFGEGFGADWFVGVGVVLDDGAQDRESAFLGHVACFSWRCLGGLVGVLFYFSGCGLVL